MSSQHFLETDNRHVVSPELVLVDPELARVAIMALPDRFHPRVVAPPPAFASRALVELSEVPVPRVSRQNRARPGGRVALAFAGALTVVVLLLGDVRVEVGRKEAAAEPPTQSPRSQPPGTAEKPTTAPRQPSTPRASKPRVRTHRARPQARRLAWAPVQGADSYHIELFRGAVRVFSADSNDPTISVPARWSYGGKSRMLSPGEYRWYVWADASGRRSPNAVVQATLDVPFG